MIKELEDLEDINNDIQEAAMISLEDNKKLWNEHFKTNPAATKKVNKGGGRSITAIDAYHQIEEATEAFGPMGRWGLADVQLEVVGEIMWMTAAFFHPGGRFETVNSINMYMGRDAKKRLDDEAGKKLATDTITKCLSYLGFNADVFFGKFDDARYIAERTVEEADVIRGKCTAALEAKLLDKKLTKEQADKLEARVNQVYEQKDLDALSRALDHINGIEGETV